MDGETVDVSGGFTVVLGYDKKLSMNSDLIMNGFSD